MNLVGDIQPLIQADRSKISVNESDLTNKILDDYEELLQLFKQKNDMINYIWNVNENEKYKLAQEILDPLEQILYSSLLGIRTLEKEAQSASAKEYLTTLKKEIERQLYELKKASISIYPICMQDLGPYEAIKSLYVSVCTKSKQPTARNTNIERRQSFYQISRSSYRCI